MQRAPLLAALLLTACADEPARRRPTVPSAPTWTATAPTMVATSPPPAPPKPPPRDESTPPAAAGPLGADEAFPPKPAAPPFEHTAKPGDGAWSSFLEGTAGAPPIGVRTLVHPAPFKPQVEVQVVAIDLRRVGVHLVAGTVEPPSKSIPPERRTGLVPREDHDRLLAVTNGGFLARHGGYGVRIGDDTFVPPREDVCTVALFADGSVDVAPWLALGPRAQAALAVRQTPPCLVDNGAVHFDLEADPKHRAWGGAIGGAKDVRRSAIGVDATGRVMFFGLGEWTLAKDLAVAMASVGAVRAAELDINWSYTRFLTYGPAKDGGVEVTGSLVAKSKHTPRAYVERASERDFFYWTRRP